MQACKHTTGWITHLRHTHGRCLNKLPNKSQKTYCYRLSHELPLTLMGFFSSIMSILRQIKTIWFRQQMIHILKDIWSPEWEYCCSCFLPNSFWFSICFPVRTSVTDPRSLLKHSGAIGVWIFSEPVFLWALYSLFWGSDGFHNSCQLKAYDNLRSIGPPFRWKLI